MMMKELVKNESSDKSPLLVNGEDSSPSCFSAVLCGGDNWESGEPKQASLSVYLVDDSTIGYFRHGEFIDYNNGGAKIELVKESLHLSEPEIQVFDTVGYSEEIVAPSRNKNGKISREGLKRLGEMAIYEYLLETDL